MYDDRLEIVSPGELHFGLKPEVLLEPHESKPWNPIIAGVFYRAGIIEKWGTGTLRIIDWCREGNNPEPQWKEQAGSLYVIFFPSRDIKGAERKDIGKPELQPESLREKVIHLLSEGPLSKSEVSKNLGQKQISGQLKIVLKSLVDEGVIAYTIPEKPKSRLQKYKLKNGKSLGS